MGLNPRPAIQMPWSRKPGIAVRDGQDSCPMATVMSPTTVGSGGERGEPGPVITAGAKGSGGVRRFLEKQSFPSGDHRMEKIRVLIAEDEGLLRSTLAELLAREQDIEVVAAAPNGREALIEALAHRPHVVLTDLRMPRMDGLELIGHLREQLPEAAIVVLTAFDDDDSLFAALKTGAIGYVLKDASVPQIVQAIHAVRAGEGFLSAALVARVVREFSRVDRMVRGQKHLFEQLTRRETEVLELLAAGLPNRQIAQRLGISDKTVRNHVSAILGKLQANDRTEAALIAARHGLGPREGSSRKP